MTIKDFKNKMADCPVIAAVKSDEDLNNSINSQVEIIFILYGTVCNISNIVKTVKNSGKTAVVHVDLIAGLNSNKDVSIDFIKEHTNADGIITTHQSIIKRAKDFNLIAIQRFFVLDSMALENITRKRSGYNPDFIEILPGLMPKIIKKISQSVTQPVIAGGLITDKEDIISALSAGAFSVSTTNEKVWFM